MLPSASCAPDRYNSSVILHVLLAHLKNVQRKIHWYAMKSECRSTNNLFPKENKQFDWLEQCRGIWAYFVIINGDISVVFQTLEYIRKTGDLDPCPPQALDPPLYLHSHRYSVRLWRVVVVFVYALFRYKWPVFYQTDRFSMTTGKIRIDLHLNRRVISFRDFTWRRWSTAVLPRCPPR